ncbi:MAG TPA: hypothetical protein VNI01_14735 [Elusimicrobiota bacterium]|jgi:hypothetical protein|nr:hypothetical protein [Elusimicrobiota bacterium]
MKRVWIAVVLAVLLTPAARGAKGPLGAAFTPAHLPRSSPAEVADFYRLVSQIGENVILITEWEQEMPLADIRAILQAAHARGLKFHLHLSPIALYGGRKTPAVPAYAGGKSFGDDSVRRAFKGRMLELAALKPDVLGMGTEVNFLAQNRREFAYYVSLVRETALAIKEKHPEQTLTVSFQWDVMLVSKKFEPLAAFKNAIDVYSLTTYPTFFKDPDVMPVGYYSSIRKLLPAERIGFSEVGWSSGATSEALQARFYANLPALMGSVRPEFVILGLLHDVSVFTGSLKELNSVGVRRADGEPKKAWDAVAEMGPW